MKRIAINLVVVLVSSLLGLLMVEVGLRLWYPQSLGLWYMTTDGLIILRANSPHKARTSPTLRPDHRVNDLAEDPLTASVERFAEYMSTLKKISFRGSNLRNCRQDKTGEKPAACSVAIHFNDYRDVYTKASAVLVHNHFPACSFVSSGFVGMDRTFPHDAAKCPFELENLCQQELVELTKRGGEIGAHTVNHVDMGRCSEDIAAFEVQQSRRDLGAHLGKPVTFFSFPFGREETYELKLWR